MERDSHAVKGGGTSLAKMATKEGVHNVHTLGLGFGCTGIGQGRIGDVFGSGGSSRVGARFESHLGHVFSLFRGLLASECGQTVHLWTPSVALFHWWPVLWPGASLFS